MDHAPRANELSAASARIVDVLVPLALNQTYSYRVPRGMELKAGDVVGVPLGPREVVAVVWGENANPDPHLRNRLKDVAERLERAIRGNAGLVAEAMMAAPGDMAADE